MTYQTGLIKGCLSYAIIMTYDETSSSVIGSSWREYRLSVKAIVFFTNIILSAILPKINELLLECSERKL